MKAFFFSIILLVAMACGSPQVEQISIFQTSDIHAYLNTHNELFVEGDSIVYRNAGGLANIKTMIERARAENKDGVLLVDGGDLIQGSGVSVLTRASIFPQLVKDMGYDLLIPGNWEVIYGKDVMMDVMSNYNTNVIVSNMFHKSDSTPIFPQYWVVEKKGVKIGFIAYNDPEVPIRQNPGFSKGLVFTPVEQGLRSLIKEMKERNKVDVLLLVAHIGMAKQVQLSNNPDVEGVDFILGNDTHERIRKPVEGKYARVLEPGAFGSFVGRLNIQVKDEKVLGFDYELVEVNPTQYPANNHMQRTIDSLTAPYAASMETVLGYTTTPLYRYLVVENPMDNMIADALLWKTGADFATSNGFRFGVPIIPDASGRMAITQEDLWRMLPVDEYMKIGKVSGQQILNWLEREINNVFASQPSKRFGGWLVRFSGMSLKFDTSKEMGQRVVEVLIQGKPLDLNKIYTMASCNRTGEPIHVLCRLPNASNVSIKDYTLHDAVKEYLKEKGVVNPELDGRAVAVDLNANTFSQMSEVGYAFK